ncbi:MAG: hypothetical protein WCA20_27880 [Candidatus Sulfotelmatobacter sp.]
MTLAAILAVCLLGMGYPGTLSVASPNSLTPESQTGGSAQAPPAQPSPSPTQPTPDSANQPKPAPKPHHRKKTSTSSCSTAAPAPNSAENSASSKPCPPPKKVVRNGGSDEPAVQLTPGATAAQTSYQRFTAEQLRVATEENLKKIDGRQLNPSQQEMVSQIKQFMEQSKKAVAAGDVDRAHNLALKARLLSDELLKP